MTSRSSSALRKPPPNANRRPRNQAQTSRRQNRARQQGRQAAGMESGRSLFRYRRAGSRARPRQRWMPNASRLRPTTKASLRNRRRAEGGGKWLAEAVRRYEAIDDLAGRLGSYAGLVHAGDSVDPAISKFYGDVSERLTDGVGASVVLRARTQPRRRCRDRTRDADARTRRITGRGSRICARTSRISSRTASSSCFTRNPRAAMPPGTGCSTRPSRRCASRSAAKELAIEPTLNLLQDRDGEKRKAAGAGAGENLQGQ